MIADDQEIVRSSLKKILSLDDELLVTCEASDGTEVLSLLDAHLVDVILMDVRMPGMDGIRAAAEVHRRAPEVRIVILTTFDEDEYLFEGIRSGISGFLLKDSGIDYILKSIHAACDGGMMIDPGVAPRLARAAAAGEEARAGLTCLTPAENRIAARVAAGKSNQQIAGELFLSEGTVKNAVSRILKKLDLQRRTQISALYYRGENRR